MQREYDLFELLNGELKWRGRTVGLLQARAKLHELSHKTRNECFAMHLPTKEIVARVNERSPKMRPLSVFEITYDPAQAIPRANLLRLQGCDVAFAIGNEAAKVVLGTRPRWDLFVIGTAAPQETVNEMMAWLKSRYPGIPILSLTPIEATPLRDATIDVVQNATQGASGVSGLSTTLALDLSRLRRAAGLSHLPQ